MWFSMMILMALSLVNSIMFLNDSELKRDLFAACGASIGMFFGTMGLITGMVWAYFTWGDWWVNDPKLNGAAVTMLVYAAYFVLRSSLEDPVKKAKVSAVYNIFAFTMLIVFLMILPRMTDSLHPGNGGNPGFSPYDVDENMKLVFYPAVIGWTLIGIWLLNLRVRYGKLKGIN